jgi:hypothetical protein
MGRWKVLERQLRKGLPGVRGARRERPAKIFLGARERLRGQRWLNPFRIINNSSATVNASSHLPQPESEDSPNRRVGPVFVFRGILLRKNHVQGGGQHHKAHPRREEKRDFVCRRRA